MIENYLPAVSTYASDIDNLFTLIFVLWVSGSFSPKQRSSG